MAQHEDENTPVYFDLYLDATPNVVRTIEDREDFSRHLHQQLDSAMEGILTRKAALPVLVVKSGKHLDLLLEARALFEHGYFYSCVAMCGITAERIVKDIFAETIAVQSEGKLIRPGARAVSKLEEMPTNQITQFLYHAGVMDKKLLDVFSKLATLRNRYAHASEKIQNHEQDAKAGVEYLHEIVEGTVSIFKHYDIRAGKLVPRQKTRIDEQQSDE